MERTSFARIAQASGLALGLMFLSGCVSESTDGDTTVFTYKWWVFTSVFLGGIVAAPAGWMLRHISTRFGWGLLIGAPLAAFVMGPGFLLDRVTVSPERFTRRSGIWAMTANSDFALAEVTSAEYVMEVSRGRRGRRKESYYLVLHLRDGSEEKLPAGNDLVYESMGYLIPYLEARGIHVADRT